MHGSGAWFVRKSHETWIQTAEVKFVCEVAGYTRGDHQRNAEIIKKIRGLQPKYKNTELQKYLSATFTKNGKLLSS